MNNRRLHVRSYGDNAVRAESGTANILLVDDHQENLLALEAMLNGMGQNLVRASSGEAALKCLLDLDFAVILMDVQMPSMDGFEVANLIRQRERSRATPIIFLTAIHRMEENIFQGYELGAVDYLFKPLVPEILRAKVSVFVDLWRTAHIVQQQAERLDTANFEQERQIREMKRLNHELEILNSELESFSYSVSHDLRGPLRRINGYAQALLEDYRDRFDAEGQEYLQRMSTTCEHMGLLIDDLLKLSRVSRAKLEPTSVNLTDIATRIAETLRTSAPERPVEFVIESNLHTNGDMRLLTIALENLMDNAWKFTSTHPSARIEFGCLASHGRDTIYFVRDDGAGFNMDYAQKLFGPFQRLHTESEFEGNGIGLATVQRIVNRHGGKIWAEARPEQGATFYFTL